MMAHFQSSASRHDFLRQGKAITNVTVYSLLLTLGIDSALPLLNSPNEINKRGLETGHPHAFSLSIAADRRFSIKLN